MSLTRLVFLSTCILFSAGQGNISCNGTFLDWYTSRVGVTPCKTYQSLRQICNPGYQVPNLYSQVDACDEYPLCCCNSVAFALMMLCMNCQVGEAAGSLGLDAAKGSYAKYLTQSNGQLCGPALNKTLPVDIQTVVCGNKLKIYDDIYNVFWADGDWHYDYIHQKLIKDSTSYKNNTFTHCKSTTLNSTSTSPTSSKSVASLSQSPTSGISSTSSTSNRVSSETKAQIIIGVVVSVNVMLIIGGLLIFRHRLHFWWKQRKQRQRPVFTPNPQPIPKGTSSYSMTTSTTSFPASSAAQQTNILSSLSSTHQGYNRIVEDEPSICSCTTENGIACRDCTERMRRQDESSQGLLPSYEDDQSRILTFR